LVLGISLPALALAALIPSWSARADPLVGDWRSGCLPVGQNGRHGAIAEVSFEPSGMMNAHFDMFERPDCATATLSGKAHWSFRTSPKPDGRIELDYTLRDFELTLHRPEVVAVYNGDAAKRCAPTSWKLEVPQSVLGGVCPPIHVPNAGSTYLDTALVQDGKLRFAAFPKSLTQPPSATRAIAPSPAEFEKLR
jgi:hypothetical protein